MARFLMTRRSFHDFEEQATAQAEHLHHTTNRQYKNIDASNADFQTYVAWLEKQPDAQSATYLAERKAWISALQAGNNPFTIEVLSLEAALSPG